MPIPKQLPPLLELQQVLDYNQNTGKFTWLVSRGGTRAGQTAGKVLLNGYRHIRFRGESWYAHRLAWLFARGEDPTWLTIDHKDGDKDNNAISNLRLADETSQRGNVGLRSDNTSGIRGVCFDKSRNKWMARLTKKGVVKNLGRFDTKKEAKAAYEKAATAYFKEFYNGKPSGVSLVPVGLCVQPGSER